MSEEEGGEFSVEKDGQKSPAGISYKLHCNLLVLFLLFITRSIIRKGKGESGNFYDFLGRISDSYQSKVYFNDTCFLDH